MTQRKCGKCGEPGHNARSCPTLSIESNEKQPPPKGNPTLVRALHAAQYEADRIDKDSKNSFSNYDYTSAESLMAMWTEISGRHGLYLIPAGLNIKSTPGEAPILETTWVLGHLRGEERAIHMDWPIVTGKGKPLDKAVASARTSSLGYLIRDLLVAPRVHPTDDMDHSRWSQAEKRNPPKKPAAKKKTDIEHFWEAIESYGYTQSQINGYCHMKGAKVPRAMSRDEHVRMLEWLIDPKGRSALKVYIDSQ